VRRSAAVEATTVSAAVRGTLSQKKAIKLFRENGWTQSRGGKHQVKMTKQGCRPITLPHHKGRDYPPGLASAILKQAGLQ
jgi:predicted RNA binding protein YcfA (HicA-like mRNA interferase family)